MRYKNDKNIKFVITRFVFASSKCTKIRSAPDPAGGAYDAPPDPLIGWGGGYPLWGGGYPLPIPLPTRRLWRLELGASPTALRFSCPLDTKSWLLQCSHQMFVFFLYIADHRGPVVATSACCTVYRRHPEEEKAAQYAPNCA